MTQSLKLLSPELKLTSALANLKFSNLTGLWFLDGGHALDSQSPHCTSHRENKRKIQAEEEGGHSHFPKETPSLKSCRANILSDIAGVWLGSPPNTTLRILSVRGVPPPFTDFFSGKKGVTDLGGTPPPTPRLRIFPRKFSLKKG